MVYKGFKFGLLLQFAIGPVCIFIFQIAALRGFYNAESGVLGVVLVDGLFIFAAIFGIASFVEGKRIRLYLKLFGATILLIFGLSTFLSPFHIDFLPSLSIQNDTNSNVFIRAFILTFSNPLTILFWAGVFSAKIAEETMERKDIYSFGVGALLSTMLFLTLIAIGGSFAKLFFPNTVIHMMNIIVGLLLIYFSVKMFLKKSNSI